MMFFSIGQRVGQYGITENRYYIILLGIWVTAMMLYYAIKEIPNNLLVVISLSIIVVNSIYGPLNSFAVSKYSQNKRLNAILSSNGILQEGRIVAKPNIEDKVKNEINNIISYFDGNHSLSDIKVLDKDFATKDMEELFGFPYVEYSPYSSDMGGYFYFNRGYDLEVLDIERYQYSIHVVYQDLNSLEIDQDHSLDYRDGHIELVRDGKPILSQNLESLAREIYERDISSEDSKEEKDIEEMSFEVENNNAKIKIIFNRIGGRIDQNTKEIVVDELDYILLISIK